jgi:ABC-type nitrate/sulfonate/bicarbonate transport system substrate-binding protein
VAKGAPTIAVGALGGSPHLTVTVSGPGPIQSVAELKGRKIGITTVASVAEWLPRELSRQQGWGSNGMQLVPLGAIPTQIAAMKNGEIDGMILEFTTASLLEQQGVGRIIVDFSKIIPDFHENIFYVRKDKLASQPDSLRRFLAGWFDTIRYMADHKAETVKIAQKVLNLPENIASRAYDAYMPGFSRDGRFSAAALAVLSRSFVDLGMLPSEPDVKTLYTEALLPKGK